MHRTDRDQPRLDVLSASARTLREYELVLTEALGPVVGGRELAAALGFASQDAFRKSRQRGRLPVPTFELDGRRGRWAATADIAAWLWARRHPPHK